MMAAGKRTKTKSQSQRTARSSCPIACALDVLGDRWTLLIIRDLFLGRTRFKDFAGSPEHMPTNILANRLERLCEQGIIETVPCGPEAKRQAYQLTDKGRALGKILKVMRDWGLEWVPGTELMRHASS